MLVENTSFEEGFQEGHGTPQVRVVAPLDGLVDNALDHFVPKVGGIQLRE